MAKSDVAFHVASLPWAEPDSSLVEKASPLHRGFIILPFECSSEVICDTTKDPLPLVGKWIDAARRRWSKFELPRGDSAMAETVIRFQSGIEGSENTVKVSLGPGIARSELDEQLDAEDVVPASLQGYVRIRNFIDQHIQFVNDLNDHLRPNRFYWEGNCNGNQIRSVYRATCRWLNSDDKDNARLALIVKLARDISRTLGQVCEKPRVVLRRTRELQSISRIQEIDPACLRWIARQPGRDIYERAGSRQELLGVVRKEDTDTLENRVVRDLLHRARVECSNYLSIYREFQSHDRVVSVSGFRRSIVDWERNSDIRDAKPLVGFAQPNYVLLHEPKYRKLWDAYLALLSQRKQKDDIWKWRDRTFAESCQFLLLSVLSSLTQRSPFLKSDLVLFHEAISGKFVSDRTQLGPASISLNNKRQSLLICPGNRAASCPFISREFYPWAVDFFLIQPRVGTSHVVVPVWCFTETDPQSFGLGLSMLEKKLATVSSAKSIHPLILTFERPDTEQVFFDGRGRVVSLDTPAQTNLDKLQALLVSILEQA
jgi:hypothetical protein